MLTHMPNKYYSSFDALPAKTTLTTSHMSTQIGAINYSLATYHAQLRTLQFTYPVNWKLESSLATEEAGIQREQVTLYNPLGGSPLRFTLAEPGKNIYFNPGNHQKNHEIAVVTAKALKVPGWNNPVFYTEIVVEHINGTFTVLYGLRSPHPLYDHVHTFTSTQDEVPLLVSEPTQSDPYTGFLVFMSAWWGFPTKAQALAVLTTPAHKAGRSVLQSISFT